MRPYAIAALVALAAAAPAAAQSKRYPPEPVDKDAEAARRSNLWEAASNPQRTPFDALVGEAKQALEGGTREGAREAVERLDRAIALVPDESRAWRMRGDAHVLLEDWARCAVDYRGALDHLRTADLEARSTADLRRRLGLCLARAGKLADAERVLAEAVAAGTANGELWMRLGEVRIALGKLEEAIGALEGAKDHDDVPQVLVRWLLAGAYDRARRPSEAIAAGREAHRMDPHLAMLDSSAVPLLGVGEPDYLAGLANTMADPPRVERALLHFRRFLEVAPTSPWKRRAEEHVRELARAVLPELVDVTSGRAPFDKTGPGRTAVRRHMPQLRTCMARLPGVLFKIEITRVGPRTRRMRLPPENVAIVQVENLDGSTKLAIDGARRCMEPIAERVRAALPAVKTKDAWYRAVFYVISP